MAVKKPGRFPSAKNRLKGITKSPFSHLHLAEAIAERVKDRVEWWIAKAPSGKDPHYIKVHIAALEELNFILPELLKELHSWRRELWPKAASELLTRHAFSAQLNYKNLYESERAKNNKAVKLALKLNSTMANETILKEIKKLDQEHLEHYYLKCQSSPR